MNTSGNKGNKSPDISREDVLACVGEGKMTLEELCIAIKERLGNCLVKDIPKECLPLIKDFKIGSNKEWQEDFKKINIYLKNTAILKKKYSGEQFIEEINDTKYLVLSENEILEIKEEYIGNIYCLYNPVSKKYKIYKFFWENLDANEIVAQDIEDITKKDLINLSWERHISTPYNTILHINYGKKEEYLSILNSGDIQLMGPCDILDFTLFWTNISIYTYRNNLELFWESLLLKTYNYFHTWDKKGFLSGLIVCNGEEKKCFQNVMSHFFCKTKEGRHLVHFYNTSHTQSLFDLDTMEFILESVSSIDFNGDFSRDFEYRILWDEISYMTEKKRESKIGQMFFWDTKMKEHIITL